MAEIGTSEFGVTTFSSKDSGGKSKRKSPLNSHEIYRRLLS